MKPLLFALMLVVTFPSMAMAHVKLVSSSPANEAILETSPQTIKLELSQAAKIISIVVESSKGEKVKAEGLPKGLVAKVEVAIPPLPAGDYVITWRGASKDMHAMSGTIKFTVN